MRYLLILTALLPMLALAGTAYKSIDANGNVVYSDTPSTHDQKVIQVADAPYTPLPDSVLRYQKELRDGIAKRLSEADLKPDPSTVTLYTTTWCGYCRKARAYLNEHKIPFQDINIETPTGAQQMLAVSSDGKGVPLLVWKNSRKRGFSTQTYDALFAKAN